MSKLRFQWDRQAGRTLNRQPTARSALLDAFAELALSRRYHEFSVGLIASRAQVGRSTFYYHFKSKDELLLENLAPMFSGLSCLALSDMPTPEVEAWAAHIWDHRVRAARMFRGALGRKITEALALELRRSLEGRRETVERRLLPLLADQIASGMVGLLQGWIAGRSSASPTEIARLLWSGARSTAQAADAAQ